MSSKIVRYSLDELIAMQRAGNTETDWQRVKNMTDEEIDAAIASDPDAEEITDEEWENAVFTVPLVLDADIMQWLHSQGEDYQTHINHLLRREMQQHPTPSD